MAFGRPLLNADGCSRFGAEYVRSSWRAGRGCKGQREEGRSDAASVAFQTNEEERRRRKCVAESLRVKKRCSTTPGTSASLAVVSLADLGPLKSLFPTFHSLASFQKLKSIAIIGNPFLKRPLFSVLFPVSAPFFRRSRSALVDD